jgi:hypothetical protein
MRTRVSSAPVACTPGGLKPQLPLANYWPQRPRGLN